MFESLAIGTVAALFVVSAVLVWLGGSRLAGYVDALTRKTGMDQAFTGMLLLGGITSLPEVAAVSTSAATGNAPLALNNLLGTASINIMLLAVADVIYGRGAITAVAARPATLMQGVLSMLLATAVAMIVTVGDVAMLGVGPGTSFLAASAVAALWISSRFEQRHSWQVVNENGNASENEEPDLAEEERSLRHLVTAIVLCAALILTAGFVLSLSADAIATKTGLAAGMVGFVLVGFATSLPEVSSITAAVRLGRYQMAMGDVFGTNIFNIMLIFLADLIYRGPPVLGGAGKFETIGAILAASLTGVFVVGLLYRGNRAILRMGYDSLSAMLIFAAGLAFLSRSIG